MNSLLSAPNPKRTNVVPSNIFSDLIGEDDVLITDPLAGLRVSNNTEAIKQHETSTTDEDRLFWNMDDDDMAILAKAKSISRPVSTSAAFSTSTLGHTLSPFSAESHLQAELLGGSSILSDSFLFGSSTNTSSVRAIARPSTSFQPEGDRATYVGKAIVRPGSVPAQSTLFPVGGYNQLDHNTMLYSDFGNSNNNNSSGNVTMPVHNAIYNSNSNNVGGVASEANDSIEMTIVRCCVSILSTAADHSLKAVELANTLRARVGTELLATVREHYGGLLSLLERHVFVFKVDRIAKNDKVTLIGTLQAGGAMVDSTGAAVGGDDMLRNRVGSGEICRSPPPRGSSASPGLPSVSRCLHIGNVPTHLTEYQLKCEFGLYGTVENLKLVSHKNSLRRFAFVTYRTLEEAYNAKQCLGKLHPWKSAISYARKDYQITPSPSPGLGTNNNNNSSSVVSSGGGMRYSDNSWTHTAMHQHDAHYDPHYNLYAAATLPTVVSPPIHVTSPPPAPSLVYNNNNTNNNNSFIAHTSYSEQLQQQQQQSLDMIDPILARLCDHTYVPTQPWPADPIRDGPYCEAIVSQLLQFGGYTTVSKLRGFLRFKVAANDNIKSVPLKALLCAYPAMFSVQNNLVSLVATPPPPLLQQQQQQMQSTQLNQHY